MNEGVMNIHIQVFCLDPGVDLLVAQEVYCHIYAWEVA